ncbi:ABC transporter, permease protein [Paenibacillus algicola]|uniref:ABC transporter, permease protein n=1 Tax=Paenibacillus algicola TaxID=2565926 RepID=A0A4P8XMI8_9BACL|nr:sugar ABC transporter permease [Paenibacillus algicola]QCT04002.1 ABC transporter, permease protein [Paenibacillus algicola]
MTRSWPRRFRGYRLKDNLLAYALLFPSLLLLAVFTFYPMVKVLDWSFYETVLKERHFAGLDQYKHVLQDEVFHKVLRNNVWLALVTVPVSIWLALYMAVWVNGKLRGRSLIRAAFFYPTLIPMIAIANIWLFIYTPDYGLLDKFLGLFGIQGPGWLGEPGWVLVSMMVMLIWKEAGYFMIFFLAGLQSLPQEVYQAAQMDGAGPLRKFRAITFPLLMPTTLFVLVIATTNSFKLVDHLYIMTKGGPNNASNLLLYHIYETAFSFWDMGKASVLTVILLVMLLAVSIFYYGFLDKRIHY